MIRYNTIDSNRNQYTAEKESQGVGVFVENQYNQDYGQKA